MNGTAVPFWNVVGHFASLVVEFFGNVIFVAVGGVAAVLAVLMKIWIATKTTVDVLKKV